MKNSMTLLLILVLSFSIFSCDSNADKQTSNTDSEEAKTETTETPITKENLTDTKTTDPEPQSPFTYGIDISKYQGDEVELLDKSKDSLSFVICKATEGITYTDPRFHQNWNAIKEKGYIRGSYHFYRSNDDPHHQSENYTHAISDLQETDLPPIVDFEGGGIDKSQPVELVQSQLLIFLEAIENNLNRKPIIYTDNKVGNKYLNDPKFAEYALWIAVYDDETSPTQPSVWKNRKWTLWQKSPNYKIGNIKNDFDIYNGTKTELIDFIKNYGG